MKNIFIDSDCGIDDATAIMIALASPDINIVGISAVAGNAGLDHVVNNITGILAYFGREDIPVYQGASTSLLGMRIHAEGVHGSNGLGDVELPENSKIVETLMAPDGLCKAAKENPGLTLVTLGPLTNIAISINLFPELKNLIKEIVIMGGALEKGNITKFAEFNFAADPESVQFVFDAGIPLTIVPWDVAVAAMYTEEELVDLGLKESRAGKLLLDMQKVPLDFLEQVFGFRGVGFPDPLTMAYVVDESIVSRKIKGNLKMELSFNTMRGASVPCEGLEMDIILEIKKEKFNPILLKIKALK
ncbi:MAG: nucleoside hydrolase [Spirochaetia bacterium]|jgi:purine nucleosidase|nr:nucleoside hydrolase [Spirochaetia bacterium]